MFSLILGLIDQGSIDPSVCFHWSESSVTLVREKLCVLSVIGSQQQRKASTLSSEGITKIKRVFFFFTLQHEMWSDLLLLKKKTTVGVICFCYKTKLWICNKTCFKLTLSNKNLNQYRLFTKLIKTTQLQFDWYYLECPIKKKTWFLKNKFLQKLSFFENELFTHTIIDRLIDLIDSQ